MASKNKPFPAWKKLEERIWQKYKDEPVYYFLNSKYINLALEQIQVNFSTKNITSVFKKHSLILKKIYQEIFKSKEFKKLHKETEKYFNCVKKQWQKNEKKSLGLLQKISGLPIPKKQISIFITHPKSCNGKTINQNAIVWGHKEDWKNYATIYLCHELLHIMTWPGHFQPHYDILHALISLATNNELRIRLNKKGEYFKERKFYTEYQKIFRNLEKKILPQWKQYLLGKLGKNIIELKNLITEK